MHLPIVLTNIFDSDPCSTSSGKSQKHKTNKGILVFLPIDLVTLILALFAFGISYHLCQNSKTKENHDAESLEQN